MYRLRAAQQDRLALDRIGRYLADDLKRAFGEAWFSIESATVHYGRENRRGRLKLDEKGRIIQSVTPLGRITSFQFIDERLAFQQSSAGVVTSFGYDAGGVLCSSQRHDNVSQHLRFDNKGDLQCHTVADGSSTWFHRDAQRRLLQLVDRSGAQTTFSYDADGRLSGVVNPRKHETRFEYSSSALPTSITHADGVLEELRYEENAIERRVAGTALSKRTYDDQGRLLASEHADGSRVEYQYGDHGKVVRATYGDVVSECQYDDHGRVVLDKTNDYSVQCAYENGNLALVALPDGSSLRYEYDADDRLIAAIDWSGQRQHFSYGRSEQPTARYLPNGLTEHYELDHVDRLNTVELTGTEGIRWQQRYAFDIMDRVAARNDTRHGSQRFDYDAGGQLLRVLDDAGHTLESYGYDAAGNRVCGSDRFVSYDAEDRPTNDGVLRYTYDARGNRRDAQGPNGIIHYEYDSRDLLAAVVHADGSRTEYRYDAFSRRIEKRHGSRVTQYVWAGHQMVQEITHDGGQVRSREFLYWPGQHRPLAMRADGHIYYFHCDRIGTPQLLTDATSRVAWSARYEAYGVVSIELEHVEQPLRFIGQYFDNESGLHYNCARYYDPTLGSYLSADPVLPAGCFNRYRYASGNPINLSDPLGLFGESLPGWVRTAAGIAAGAAVVGAAILLAPATLTIGAAVALTVGVGALAGAVGFGVEAALTPGACVLCAMGKGAVLGAIGAVPFAIATLIAGPAALGLGVVMGLGAAGGAMSYASDCLIYGHPWDTGEFIKTVALSAVTAGVFKVIGGKLAALKGGPEPTEVATEEGSPAAEKPPEQPAPGAKGPPIQSGLGPGVDAIANRSPTLQNDVTSLENQGWKIEQGQPGAGSRCNRSNQKIVLDPGLANDPNAGAATLAHEVGHAKGPSPSLPDPATAASKQSYVDQAVDQALLDEGNATLKNAQVRREILDNGGPDIGFPGDTRVQNGQLTGNGVKYDQIAQEVSNGTKTPEQGAREIGQIYGQGERVSGDGRTYDDYMRDAYGQYYDAKQASNP